MYRLIKRLIAFVFRLSPYLVLLFGSVWIAWILFNPPLYVICRDKKLPYDLNDDYLTELCPAMSDLYPTPDYITAILHSMGVAVITGMIFYLLKKVVSAKNEEK